MFTDDVEGATDIVSNCRFDSPNISCVKGWLEVMKSAGEKSAIENAQTHFEEALAQDESYLEAFFGLARVGEIAKKSTLTQNSVNEILLNHPSYVPGLLDKCRMCLSLQDFTQLYEVVNETLREERNNLIAYKYWAVYAMVSEGAHDVTLEKYERLSELITQSEPSNVNFMLGTAKIMSRICGRSNTIINISIKMLEKCRSIASADVEILTELAYNYLMINEIDKAYALYKDAAGIDFSRSEPTIGMIRTLISKGDLDEAESQLMF
jgi:tetratricopeptide (TPR) repeat protein